MPIINEKKMRKYAADQIYGLRKSNASHKEEANKIFVKHGSRKSNLKSPLVSKKAKNQAQRERLL